MKLTRAEERVLYEFINAPPDVRNMVEYIGQKLQGIKPSTVKTHFANIKKKYGVLTLLGLYKKVKKEGN